MRNGEFKKVDSKINVFSILSAQRVPAPETYFLDPSTYLEYISDLNLVAYEHEGPRIVVIRIIQFLKLEKFYPNFSCVFFFKTRICGVELSN